jgi:hypothetical protein
MNRDDFEELEHRLAGQGVMPLSMDLRGAVLADVHRELAAARWDRRLARVAAVLLAIGVGMNLVIGLRSDNSTSASRQIASVPSQDSLVRVAKTVADATDAETGSRFARQMAAMSGVLLSSEQSAAIDAAVKRHARPASSDGKDG